MNPIVELLDSATQTCLRNALRGQAYERVATALDDETLAALAIVGEHPDQLRAVAVALMPTAQRQQAQAYDLVHRTDTPSAAWSLSPEGHEVCSLLAAALPEPTEAERRQAKEEYARLMDEADDDLQLRPDGRPRENP